MDQYDFRRPLVTRHYATLSSAAMQEYAQSRLYLGIHWFWDRDDGLLEGTEVGNYVFQNAHLPVKGPTPKVVSLPLTPQRGTYASPLGRSAADAFEILRNRDSPSSR